MTDPDIIGFLNLGFYLFDQRIVELNHFSCVFENKMIMLPSLGSFLKLGIVRPELMFCDQATIQQEFNGIV